MIDPLEAVISYLASNLKIVEGRVAAKHRFANAWKLGQVAVVVRLDGGTPDLYSAVHRSRLEIDIYGEDQPEITAIWMDLVALSRSTCREAQPVHNGTALIQYLVKASELSLPYDNELGCDFGMAFFDAMISEEAV